MLSKVKHIDDKSEFHALRNYLIELRRLALGPIHDIDCDERYKAALNGEANNEIRKVISIDVQRKFGAFFTDSILSERLLIQSKKNAFNNIYYDPSCGMGDLLLPVAKCLPLGQTFGDTLNYWGQHLTGTDLHPEFIEGAKARLILIARLRHGIDKIDHLDWNNCFPNIRVADGLIESDSYEHASIVLLNPPFGIVRPPEKCDWARGHISESATFVITALERCKPGVEIRAILPDVLRSGSLSQRWKNKVSQLSEVKFIEPYGRFNKIADVDVFVLFLLRRHKISVHKNWQWPQGDQIASKTIGNYFNIHVGRVVPHRDKNSGAQNIYIHSRSVPPWTILTKFTETRKHSGKAFLPPFVVIRRTSSPTDQFRATATVISGKSPIFVENHLIVCEPKDRKLATCKKLIQKLKTEKVNSYLNIRIRCRHLTVDAVSSIPYSQ
jgi:hypothetical protein